MIIPTDSLDFKDSSVRVPVLDSIFSSFVPFPLMKNSWIVLIILVVVAIVTVLALILMSDGSRDDETVALGVMAKTGPLGLLYSYGEEKGIFERYGLNVTYNGFNEPYTCMIAMLTGKIDAASSSSGIAASAYSDGENITIGMAVNYASDLMLIVKPGYTDVQNLKGKRVGVMGTNSDSYRIANSYLRGRGLDLETDVELMEIRNPANILTGFKTDQLEAAVLMAGFAVEAINSGGIVVTTIADAGKDVFDHPAYGVILLLGDHFLERKNVADKFLRALRETAGEIGENSEEAVEIHAAFVGETPEKMRAVYENIGLVCDLDREIQEDIIVYTNYGTAQGYFEKAFGEDEFYDDWR